jgi:DNA-binding Lrp family transcriptional regulator
LTSDHAKVRSVTDATQPDKLDDLDRRIVAALQAAPRASWTQLGSVVAVSETTVMRRV